MLKYEDYKRRNPNLSESLVGQSYITYRNNELSLSMGGGSKLFLVTAQGGVIEGCNDIMLMGDGDGTYAWTGPNGFTSSEQNPTVSVAGTYELTVTSSGGRSGSATAIVTIDNSGYGGYTIGGEVIIFVTSTTGFSATKMHGGEILSIDSSHFPIDSGSYCLWSSDSNGDKSGDITELQFLYTGFPLLEVNLSGYDALTTFVSDGVSLTSIDVSSNTLLTYFSITGTSDIINMDFSQNIKIELIQIDSTTFTTILIPTTNTISQISLIRCDLTEESVNHVLAQCKSNGMSSGIIDLSLGTSAPPSGQGIIDKADLITAGVNVETN